MITSVPMKLLPPYFNFPLSFPKLPYAHANGDKRFIGMLLKPNACFGFVFDVVSDVYRHDVKIFLPSVPNQNDQQDLTQRLLKLVRALRPGLR